MAKKKTIDRFTWNHRVVEHDGHAPSAGAQLAIHEAHYPPGATEPNLITTGPVAIWGSSKKELRETLRRMLRALDKPTLRMSTFVYTLPKKLKEVDSKNKKT